MLAFLITTFACFSGVEAEQQGTRSAPSAAQVTIDSHFTRPKANGSSKPLAKHWSDIIGKQVQGEGIAWGALEKGFGDCVLMDGVRLYVKDGDFPKSEIQGKLVRVRGVLYSRVIKASDGFAQGPAVDQVIYEVRDATVEVIDAATWPWLVEIQ